MDFDYKKYSLENLENWMHDALSCSEATPQEIYDVIKSVVSENYHIYKNHTERCYELLALLNSGVDNSKYQDYLNEILSCDKNDSSEECKTAWSDFWEEHYYPEEYKEPKVEDIMPPWGHSDMEALRYTEEELNSMCDKAESDEEKNKCREYNLREAEYYDKRAKLDTKYDKVKKWVLPVEETRIYETDEIDYFVTFPDDLLEAADLKEGDQVEWIDRGDGSFLLKKVKKEMSYDEAIAAGWTMTADGFWIKEN